MSAKNPVFDPEDAWTSGNRSFLPCQAGEAEMGYACIRAMLDGVNAFELAHPDLEIVQWRECVSHENDLQKFVLGVFIDHRPRATPAQE